MGHEKKSLLDIDDPLAPDGDEEWGAGVPERATVIPSFDPQRLADESELRARLPSISREELLEAARLSTMKTAPPAGGGAATAPPAASVEILAPADPLDAMDEGQQIAFLTARLAPAARVPELARPLAQLGSLLSDPKTAYVAGFVDGMLPLETIVDVTGLPQLETLRILDKMILQGIIVFR